MRRKQVGATAVATGLALSVLAGCGSGASSDAADPSTYYKGKTIQIVSAAAAGGGADSAARVLASYMTKYIPGHPKVNVVNITGGGGIQGGNAFAADKSDGTHFLVTSSTVTLPGILQSEGVKYDFNNDVSVWEVPSTKVYYAATSTGVTSVADLAHPKEQLVAAGTAPGSTEADSEVLYDALGIYSNLKFIYGYSDSVAVQNAVLNGETNFSEYGVGSFLRSYKSSLLDSGKATVIMDSGVANANGTSFVRDPNLPDVPTAVEAYKTLHNGQAPSGEAWDVYVTLTNAHAWALLTEKDIPSAALSALNTGFARIVKDPSYQAALKPITPYTSVGGAAAAKWSENLNAIDPKQVDWLKSFIAKEVAAVK